MLVPFVLSKYPLETIIWSIDEVWDPLSSTQTKNLAKLLNGQMYRSLPWAINR